MVAVPTAAKKYRQYNPRENIQPVPSAGRHVPICMARKHTTSNRHRLRKILPAEFRAE